INAEVDSRFCSKSWYDNGLHVEVNNIKKVVMNEIISAHSYSLNDEQHPFVLPKYISNLKKLNLPAWGFTQRLVDVFCGNENEQIFHAYACPCLLSYTTNICFICMQSIFVLIDDIVPRFAYRKIKLFLLLSLVSLSEKQSKKHCISPSIHIMIISDGYNSIIPKMIRHVSKLKRHEEWTYGNGQKKQPLFIIQNGQGPTKENFIESTILARSQGGILMVNLDSLSKRDVESLRLDLPAKVSTSGRQTVKELSTFDLVVYLKECVDSEANGLLVDHLLDKKILESENDKFKKEQFGLSFNDFRQ
ncbi:5688_t:CDS:2, partial [Scutellospora calospora]